VCLFLSRETKSTIKVAEGTEVDGTRQLREQGTVVLLASSRRMSTDREVSKRRLSRSEGTGIESDTVNLCEQQKHQHHQQQKQQYKEPASTTNQTTLLSPSVLSFSQPKWGETAQDEENEGDSNLLAQASKSTITIEGKTAATVTATTESVATFGSDGPRQVIALICWKGHN